MAKIELSLEEYEALKQHRVTAENEAAELRKQLTGVAAQVDGLELDLSVQQSIIKIETARMTELGGYFNYLAAVKEAETLTKLTKPGEQNDG